MKFIVATICCFLIVTCAEGNPQRKIFGGSTAGEGQFKYQVSLQLFGNHFCGGSILNSKFILTACHCFYNESQAIMEWKASATTVYVGSIDKDKGTPHKVKKLICHEEYSHFYKLNDIALLILETEILFSENVEPINLPTSNIAGGKILTASGWGMVHNETTLKLPKNEIYPEYLQFLDVTIKNSQECLNILEGHFDPVGMLCGKSGLSWSRPRGLCDGDSGGPLVADGIQYGIVSWGYEICATEVPDVFTNVFSYIDWIQKKMLF